MIAVESGAAGLVGLEDVKEAARRIQGKAHLTPVLTCSALDDLAGCRLFFKCENLQKVGRTHPSPPSAREEKGE